MEDIDLGYVGDELGFVGGECTDDAFEGCGNIGKGGDATPGGEGLAIGGG